MRTMTILLASILVMFILPAMATAAWWTVLERPSSWRSADWGASGVLPPAASVEGSAIYVLAARTGGLKGAFSLHSWIVLKRAGESRYQRYDKVGWGSPVRRNGWAADGLWYSNRPTIVASATGDPATALVARAEAAIAAYPFNAYGDYRIWPGPNSNSFVAYVLRALPELGARLPPNAVGRDYRPGLASIELDPARADLHATLGGLAGFAIGRRSGIEVHFLGLVAGYDFAGPGLKVPALGLVPVPSF